MSLSTVAQQVVDTIWTTFADFVTTGDLVFRGEAPVYDPDTSTMTISDTTVSSVEMIPVQFKAKEISNQNVRAGDHVLYIKVEDIGANDFDEDTKVVIDGETRRVVSFMWLPNEAQKIAIKAHITKRPS